MYPSYVPLYYRGIKINNTCNAKGSANQIESSLVVQSVKEICVNFKCMKC